MKSKLLLALVISLGLPAQAIAAPGFAHVAALELAVDQGDAKSQTELALKYEHAEGVARDFQRANGLYCQAAKQGYAEAQFKLGWIYANARGVPRDDAIAAALFGMAAAQGHVYAAKLLQYVRPRPDTQMPECLSPDPLPERPVRVAEVAPRPETGQASGGEIEQIVRRLAPQFSVDPLLALAVISIESAFNPRAVSPKNARGLMQLMPGTAERFGVKQVFDPIENISGGLAYLRWLLAFFQGDVQLVLAGYNAGERAVERYRGIPPFAETRAYVRKISGMYGKGNHPYEPGTVEPSQIMSKLR